MDNLDKDLKEMRRLGYTSYGKYKLDYPNTKKPKPKTKPVQKEPKQHSFAEHHLICGTEFKQVRASHKYCGPECKRTAALENQRKWRARLKESKNGISV